MNPGISKKVIISSFFFINILQPSKSADFHSINKKVNNQIKQISWSKILNKDSSNFSSNNNFKETYDKRDSESLQTELSKKKEELVIQSDKQYEINDVLYADGNVSVSYGGKLLQADNLIYDKLNKKISAEGNITLVFGRQILQMSKLEYNFKNESGFLLDVKGFINSDKLISDISSNFYDLDVQKLNRLLNLR